MLVPDVLSLPIAIAAVLAAPSHAGERTATTEPTAAPVAAASPDDATAALRRAKAAAAAGDYTTALGEFELAMRELDTPAIHFNVAVCHHSLMLELPAEDPAHEQHRVGAITAYREYLARAPEADDRAEVEAIVRELGGDAVPDTNTPAAPPPALHDIVERIDPDPPTVKPQPVEPTQPPARQRWPARVGPFFPVALAHFDRLRKTDLVATVPMIGLGIRGGAFLGARGRVHLGGEFAGLGQPVTTTKRHTLRAAQALVTTEWGPRLGRGKRVELTVGGVLGLMLEGLWYEGSSPLACRTRNSGRVSKRTGLLLGPRVALLLLLGKRRNHELGLRVTPALGVNGRGSADDPAGQTDCAQAPFAEAGLPAGATLVTTIDLGYAPRF